MRKIDISGKKFGRLTVVKLDGYIGIHRAWLCKCDCGNMFRARTGGLRNGANKSCGCLFREWAGKLSKTNITHGLSGKSIYHSWSSMIYRCYCDYAEGFEHYGGRGIKVCEFLRASPENLKISIGDRPKKRSLDRIDVNGNYSCGQCAECLKKKWIKNIRWATQKQQNSNRRDNILITINGETKCAAEWDQFSNLSAGTVRQRVNRGWPIERLLIPSKHSKN